MASVVFCPVMFNLAETTRMIEVAKALDPAHTPVFMGYETDFAHLVTDAGFDFRRCEPAWSQAEREQAMKLDQGKALRSPFTRELVRARVEVERSVIREHDAKAVVIGSNVTSLLSARAEGVPLFYPVTFGLTRPQVQQTKRMGLVRGTGMLPRAADRVATGLLRWAYLHAPLAPRAFTTVAKEIGVQPLKTLSSMLEADVNLVCVIESELEGYTLPADFRRVGPIFAHLDAPMPPVVAELAAAAEPLVYLALGSSADRSLALAAAQRLADLPVNVVSPIGHYLQPGDAVPANVHVTGLLPAHQLGGLVDAAVLHGGQGTVQTACATGIPFVGMGLQPEQVWNVDVCARRGNAISLPPKAARTTKLPEAVMRVLREPSFRAAAARVRAEYAGQDGAAASARIIERAL